MYTKSVTKYDRDIDFAFKEFDVEHVSLKAKVKVILRRASTQNKYALASVDDLGTAVGILDEIREASGIPVVTLKDIAVAEGLAYDDIVKNSPEYIALVAKQEAVNDIRLLPDKVRELVEEQHSAKLHYDKCTASSSEDKKELLMVLCMTWAATKAACDRRGWDFSKLYPDAPSEDSSDWKG